MRIPELSPSILANASNVTALPPITEFTEIPVKVTSEKSGSGLQQSKDKTPQPDQIQKALVDVNKAIKTINERLEFKVHQATNTIMVKVIDTQTNKVVKEIPPEKFLDLVAKLQELVGMFVDKRV